MARIQEHGTAHNRNVLDGAFERVDIGGGDYVLMNGGRFYDKNLNPIPVPRIAGDNVEEVTPRHVPVLMKGVI